MYNNILNEKKKIRRWWDNDGETLDMNQERFLVDLKERKSL